MYQIPADLGPAHTGELPLPEEHPYMLRDGIYNSWHQSLISKVGGSESEARRRLSLVGLFQKYVSSRMLAAICQEQFSLPIWLVALSEAEWEEVLDAVSDRNFELDKRTGYYEKNWTSLRGFQRLAHEELATNKEGLEQAFVTVYNQYGTLLSQALDTNFLVTVQILQREEENLLYALQLGRQHKLWDSLSGILQGLCVLWTTQGSWDEWANLVLELESLTLGETGEILLGRENLWRILSTFKQEIADFQLELECKASVIPRLNRTGNARTLAFEMYKLGSIALKRSHDGEAQRWLQQSLCISEHIGNEVLQGEIFHKLGTSADRRSNFISMFGSSKTTTEALSHGRKEPESTREDAVRWYEQSIVVKARLTDKRGQAKVLCRLAELFLYKQGFDGLYFTEGVSALSSSKQDMDDAIRLYQQALRLSVEIGAKKSQAESSHHLGRIAEAAGQWEEAERYYTGALTAGESVKGHLWGADIMHSLGTIAERRGDEHYRALLSQDFEAKKNIGEKQRQWNAAIKWYIRSASIKERTGDRNGQAISLQRLAAVYVKNGKKFEGQRCYRQNLAYFAHNRMELWQARTLYELGMIALSARQWEEADQWFRQALPLWEQDGALQWQAKILHKLGMIATKRGQWEEGARCCSQSLNIQEQLGNQRGQAVNLHQLGMISEQRNQWQEATDFYSRAEKILVDLNDIRGLSWVHEAIYRIKRREKMSES